MRIQKKSSNNRNFTTILVKQLKLATNEKQQINIQRGEQ